MSEEHDNKPADYEVGYGRPPAHTRFRKGQSGNPKGRRPQGKTLPEEIVKAMSAKVAVTENGERKLVRRGEVIVRQLTNKAAAGDLRAIRLLADLCPEVKEAVAPMFQIVVSEDDMAL